MTQEQIEHVDTVIIGGGLCGVYAASLLAAHEKKTVLLEARTRLGGRILSPCHDGFSADLGPSWFWPDINPHVSRLAKKLDLERYPQFEQGYGRFQGKDGRTETVQGYPMMPAAYRLKGGMMALVTGLLSRLPRDVIRLSHPVCGVERLDMGVKITVGRLDGEPMAEFLAQNVILAMPPRLAARSILFTPDFSYDLTQAMLRASTWMAGHAKFFALYSRADWRDSGFSGQGFSLCGPLGEIHDASGPGDTPFGLTGFMGIPALRRKDRDTTVKAVIAQLTSMYGDCAADPVQVYYQDWAKEAFTATEYDKRSAHNHPEFSPPSGKTSVWDGTFHFAGTETAGETGGYLEGALDSAVRAVSSVMKS